MNLLPFAMLALAAGLAFGINGGSSSKLLTEAALTAAAASWMLMMLALRRSWEQRLSGALLAGLIALMVALVIVNPTFGFFAWTGYIWTFRLVQTERWRALGLIATSVATGTSSTAGCPTAPPGGGSRGSRSSRSTCWRSAWSRGSSGSASGRRMSVNRRSRT